MTSNIIRNYSKADSARVLLKQLSTESKTSVPAKMPLHLEVVIFEQTEAGITLFEKKRHAASLLVSHQNLAARGLGLAYEAHLWLENWHFTQAQEGEYDPDNRYNATTAIRNWAIYLSQREAADDSILSRFFDLDKKDSCPLEREVHDLFWGRDNKLRCAFKVAELKSLLEWGLRFFQRRHDSIATFKLAWALGGSMLIQWIMRPRFFAACFVGLVPLMVTAEGWRVLEHYFGARLQTYGVAGAITLLVGGYHYLEIVKRCRNWKLAIFRALLSTAHNFILALLASLLYYGAFGFWAEPDGKSGFLYSSFDPSSLDYSSFDNVSFFLLPASVMAFAIVLQAIWQEKTMTEPL